MSASRQDSTVRLYQADDDLVFGHPHTGNPIDNSKLLKRFKKALKAAELRELRLHDLRHTFGTRMAAAGVPMRARRKRSWSSARLRTQGSNLGSKLSETQVT